jgi:DNA-binding NarL/FixJ family response regulator
MIYLLSDDYLFIKKCNTIFTNEKLHQLNTVKLKKIKASVSNQDVLLFDTVNTAINKLSKIECAAVALSNTPNYNEAIQLLNLGFRGYGNKYMLPENLLQTVETVRSNQVWLPPDILAKMISQIPKSDQSEEQKQKIHLTQRESEVASLVSKGLSNKEISKKMGITIRTAKSHLTSIFAKTGYRDRLELAVNYK